MAPGRKRGANRAKTKNQLSIGDLVLAKVKGFPAWPAKISRPEDWERTPDPKKYFVQFFGTSEIAFVAGTDIQEFTIESKNKLTARCQGKTVKDFSRAVKEICEAFEELQRNSSGECIEEEIGKTAFVEMASSVDGEEDEIKDETDLVGPKDVTQLAPGNEKFGLERCSRRQDETVVLDVKHDIACDAYPLSPGISGSKETLCDDGSQSTKQVESTHKLIKEVSVNGLVDERGRDVGVATPVLDESESPSKNVKHEKENHLSENAGDAPCGLATEEKGDSSVLALPTHGKEHGAGKKVLTNGQKATKMVSTIKKKGESMSDVRKSALSSLKSPKHENSDGKPAFPGSAEHPKNRKQKKSAPCDNTKEPSSDVLKPATESTSVKKVKRSVKLEHLKEGDTACDVEDPRKDFIEHGDEQEKNKPIVRGDHLTPKGQVRDKKRLLSTDEDLRPGKRLKGESVDTSATKKLISKTVKNDSVHSSTSGDNKPSKSIEGKQLLSRLDGENRPSSRVAGCSADTDSLGDGTVLPKTKRRRQALDASSVSAIVASKSIKTKGLGSGKNESSSAGHGRSLVNHAPSRRRAVRLFDDDDDECTTPVHGQSQNKFRSSSHPEQNIVDKAENLDAGQIVHKDGISRVKTDSLSPSPSQSEPNRPKTTIAHVSCSTGTLESQKLTSQEEISELVPHQSPVLVTGTKQIEHTPADPQLGDSYGLAIGNKPAEHKNVTPHSQTSGTVPVKRTQVASAKGSVVATKKKPTVSSENSKVNAKTTPQTTDEPLTEHFFAELERLEAGRDDKLSTSSTDVKISDSVTSMKHLIAVAQAKRRQAHSQSISLEHRTSAPISTVHVVQGSISPGSASKAFPFGTSIATQNPLRSPLVHGLQFKSQQGDQEEFDEGRVSSGHRAPGGSLSGGTEAAVARDAFEGMIETLSRTKESIGRATRLAIDCAKYGIASEVVELLIRKLESEASFHRKIDLFFLVDSITQCSHSQKGIAGASYIPTVQAALPRLLGAAAPSGAGARENRRQCHKVLRLWLERKILPESLLRRYINDIGGSNDDMTSGFFLKRPSRAERAIDDPIREMEGMLVDEYGSNATFQLPGLLSSHVLEDEDNLSGSFCNMSGDESEVEAIHAPGEQEACAVTPIDRRHRILEDVDGELEMEDVSGSVKEEKPIDASVSFKLDSQQQSPNRIRDSTSVSVPELPPEPLGSPPLPFDSPPTPPPLPSSPPPPPPPSSPLPPPPPPPPPLPLPPVQPPPPSMQAPGPLPSLTPPLPLLPQQCLPPQQSLPPQPLMPPHQPMPPQPSLPSSAMPLGYQPPPMHQEFNRTQNGNQHVQMTGNAPHPGHINVAHVNNPSQLVPGGMSHSHDPSGFASSRPSEFGHNEMYLNPQNSQPNQQFQAGNNSFAQRPFHHAPPAQPSTSYLTYNKPTAQHHMQQPFPHSYPPPSFPNGRRQFAVDEHWKMPPNDHMSDNQHPGWVGGGRPPSSGPTYLQEGFFRQPNERPSNNVMGFQHPVHNTQVSGAPMPGQGVGHPLPCPPDISARHMWRPT